MTDEHRDDDELEKEQLDPGAFIGRKPELASETIPHGVRPDDERVAAHDSQSSGEGGAEHGVEGRRDEWPGGHRDADEERGGAAG